METVIEVAGLVLLIGVVRAATRRIRVPEPIGLLVVGIALSFVPGVPSYWIAPDAVLMVVLPLLLYGAAFTASLPDFRANLLPIGLLSIGLTLFTVVTVGLVAHAIVPGLPYAAAFALGAIVAPPDAVAAVSVGRQVGMPSRVVVLLEGESLFNDAAALTAYQVAVGAAVGGSIDAFGAGGTFLLAALGGAAVGAVAALALVWVRSKIADPLSDTTFSLLAPFVAFAPAEQIHASGLVAVVVAGLYLGHRSPTVMDASARIVSRSVWKVIDYLIGGAVFVLIGLRLPDVIAGLSGYTVAQLVWISVIVVLVVVVSRFAWVFATAYLSPLVNRKEQAPPWQQPAQVAWAGMRGVVSLAAAFALPVGEHGFPQRDLVLFLTFVVIATTLLGQGLSLPAVVRRLQLPSTEPVEHSKQEAAAHDAVASAASARLDELLDEQDLPPEVVERLRQRVERWQVFADNPAHEHDDESAADTYRRIRQQLLAAERAEIIRMRDNGDLAEPVFARLQRELDLEEASL